MKLNIVKLEDVQNWLIEENPQLAEEGLGRKKIDNEYAENVLRFPPHIRFIIGKFHQNKIELGNTLQSFPFYSLCKGLLLPLSGMAPEKISQLFGLKQNPLSREAKEELVNNFLEKDLGLDIQTKIAFLLGDPFLGKKSTFRRDKLIRFLSTIELKSRTELLEKLTQVGDAAILFADYHKKLKQDHLLTAAEVFYTLKYLPEEGMNEQFNLLRDLFNRMGRLEAYFLAKLLLRKAVYSSSHQSNTLIKTIANYYKLPEAQINQAVALTDLFEVIDVLENDGKDGLQKIRLQPLSPIKPALASNDSEIKKYPTWVERKYDGIRLILHKKTDSMRNTLCGAYTRMKNDWLELIPGLDFTIKMIPAQSFIIDGELYGTVMTLDGARPATVYELHAALRGDKAMISQMKFAAFDVLYLNGSDITSLPLKQRRQILEQTIMPLQMMQTPIQVELSTGQLAANKNDVNKLYNHFRAQGYEGIIAKDLESPYKLATRDSTWVKRKPVITLDLVIQAAILSASSTHKRMFGSYILGARTPDGQFVEACDVSGMDQERDLEIQQLIMQNGLMTGKQIEKRGSTGSSIGYELLPHIVLTVKFEGITKDFNEGKLSLRDPKIVTIRADKSADECDLVSEIEKLYLKQRVG